MRNYAVILGGSARHLQEDAESLGSHKEHVAVFFTLMGFALVQLTLERTLDAS